MKRWIGRWLCGVAILHTIFGCMVFSKPIASVVDRGVFNTVGNDPLVGAVVWFLLFGVVLFIAGLAVDELERSSAQPLPKSLGWSLLALTTLGVVLMPDSGFWLVFPPALAILFKRPRGEATTV